ncbi:MAG: acylphosphatase [Candidatus Cloacimonetes bacterium]|nr:acylphosphatase [Candidatus Cloacimonadota bacterium]
MEHQTIQTLKFKVTGRVQGVSFRYSTMLAAQKLGVCGNIKNEADGSVSGIIQGSPIQVEAMIEYLHKGPRFALVESVQINAISPINVKTFEILV